MVRFEEDFKEKSEEESDEKSKDKSDDKKRLRGSLEEKSKVFFFFFFTIDHTSMSSVLSKLIEHSFGHCNVIKMFPV